MNNPLNSLSSEEQSKWFDTLSNYALGESECIEQTGATYEDIEEFMLDGDYERCNECQWFMPSYMFLDDDFNVFDVCEDCRGNCL